MKVKDLLEILEPYKNDDEISIRVLQDGTPDEENYWLYDIEVSEKGDSGYPCGEIRLIGGE